MSTPGRQMRHSRPAPLKLQDISSAFHPSTDYSSPSEESVSSSSMSQPAETISSPPSSPPRSSPRYERDDQSSTSSTHTFGSNISPTTPPQSFKRKRQTSSLWSKFPFRFDIPLRWTAPTKRRQSSASWPEEAISPTTTAFHASSLPLRPTPTSISIPRSVQSNDKHDKDLPFPFGRPVPTSSTRGRSLGYISSISKIPLSATKSQFNLEPHPGDLVDFGTATVAPSEPDVDSDFERATPGAWERWPSEGFFNPQGIEEAAGLAKTFCVSESTSGYGSGSGSRNGDGSASSNETGSRSEDKNQSGRSSSSNSGVSCEYHGYLRSLSRHTVSASTTPPQQTQKSCVASPISSYRPSKSDPGPSLDLDYKTQKLNRLSQTRTLESLQRREGPHSCSPCTGSPSRQSSRSSDCSSDSAEAFLQHVRASFKARGVALPERREKKASHDVFENRGAKVFIEGTL